jgi:peptidyl-dipeptidase A
MSHKQFNQFLASHLSHIEPLSRQAKLAYWGATISGKREDFARYAALEVAYNKTYADRGTFEMLSKWREDDAISDPIERRQLDLLYREYLRNQIPDDLIERMSTLSSEIANKFNVYRARVDGDELTGNEVRTILRESTDSDYRRRVWEAEKGVGAVVRNQLMELVKLRNEAAETVGFGDYYTMSLELSEQEPDVIISLFDDLDKKTRGPFGELKAEVDSILAARYDLEADGLMPWHYNDSFFQEAPRVFDLDLDKYYRDHDVVELVSRFYDGIGLEAHGILKKSDLYEKPGKEQHAYCMDIDRRGDIRVLANVQNDEIWTGTMLHELGHAVYDLYIDPELPYLLREHAHIFTTEAIAMLFGRLSKDADWIQSITGIPDEEKKSIERDVRRNQKLSQLVFTRWCQVMVRFERALYADPSRDLNALWWELVERFQAVSRPDERNEPDWAAKIHVVSAPAYYHNYMLGELLASQLDHTLQTRVLGDGDDGRQLMNDRREAGAYLVEHVFSRGRRLHWDRMIREATGEPLNPRYFVEQFITSS